MEIKFTYNNNGIETEKEFENYLDLVEFVATNLIKDDDFISLKMGDSVIRGIQGLAGYALGVVRLAREAIEQDGDEIISEFQEEYNI